MRPALPVKAMTADLHEARKLASAPSHWPGAAAAHHAPFETALEVQFHGVENLIRALNDLTGARGRRRRRARR
jgi:hypothetical protein